MKLFNDTKRSRLKLAVYFGTGILVIGLWAAFNSMEGTASAAVVALAAIVAKYMNDETKRKSLDQ